jgi:hypothetical protein
MLIIIMNNICYLLKYFLVKIFFRFGYFIVFRC